MQCTRRFFRIGDHRYHQVRDAVIDTQFHNLRINHNQLDLFGVRLVEDAHDNRVDTYGLTGTRRTGNQKMRHLGNVRHRHLSADVLSDAERNL